MITDSETSARVVVAKGNIFVSGILARAPGDFRPIWDGLRASVVLLTRP